MSLLAFLSNVTFGAQDLVRLTMTERCGVERNGEYVTFGVPLPKGKVQSADNLVLLRDESPVPAEFLPVTQWWEDGSLRWVHLVFQTDCAANGSQDVTVALTDSPVTRKPEIRVTDKENSIAVDTGPLQFQIRKTGFNQVDRASVSWNEIVAPHSRNLGVRVAGAECLAALDPNVEVVLEETGSHHAVIHARGAFMNKEGERRFDYDCGKTGTVDLFPSPVIGNAPRIGRNKSAVPVFGGPKKSEKKFLTGLLWAQ